MDGYKAVSMVILNLCATAANESIFERGGFVLNFFEW